ncbi:hypothetical protein [Streptomyces acidiscabies]|uniref:Uncharacterized protein n=1 Tax=Streptomyces acidiscabies TaxID=42234 RepID=A0ABU4LM28_9ACTN|nr:hypothetical protein [Streptomyces acidiscabies]MDX3016730.1 hypothetical protein [Streptomyces acidiscabies]
MFLVYTPEGSSEPKRWRYNPRKIMSVERENIERLTGRNWAAFTKEVVEGSSLCRRALLYTLLKREHPPLKFDDVDFAWDELELAYSRGELAQMREAAADSAPADMRAAVLARIDEQIAEAFDDPEEEGKARPPIAD